MKSTAQGVLLKNCTLTTVEAMGYSRRKIERLPCLLLDLGVGTAGLLYAASLNLIYGLGHDGANA